jgi:hypothetical protein
MKRFARYGSQHSRPIYKMALARCLAGELFTPLREIPTRKERS